MKLLWLTHFVPFPATGHGALQRTHHLLVEAAKRHEVSLIALDPHHPSGYAKTGEAIQFFAPKLVSCDILPLAGYAGSFTKRLAMVSAIASRQTYWEKWFGDAHAEATFRDRIRTFAPDLVHIDSVVLGKYARFTEPASLVLTHHNIESDLYRTRATLTRGIVGLALAREARKLALEEHKLASTAVMNIMVSESDRARLLEFVPQAKTAVVPNGVDLEYFKPSPKIHTTPKSLIFVGGMDWYPNRIAVEWLVREIWPRLASQDGARTLTIVGREPPETVVRTAGRDTRIRVTGFVDDVRPLVASSAAYLCPIHEGGGTRLKILDALSMGCPLVSTSLGVSGLGLHEGLHYLAAETSEDFVRQVGRLEEDPRLRGRLVENGLDFVKRHHSWRTIGSALAVAYSDALNASNS